MDKALYLAMSGAKQNMLSQRAHANNLANVNTTGFKQDFAQARSISVFGPKFPSRAYALSERPGTDLSSGALIETGRSLDVAISGKGWIAVQAPDGSEAYTRAGDLSIDVNGLLKTGGGFPVIGNGGIISVPPSGKIEIGLDGTISVIPQGQTGGTLAEVDRIRLVNPDPANLEKGLDGLIHIKSGSPKVAPDAQVRLRSGLVEGSNVNAVASLIDIMSLSRQYEMQVKLMQNAKQNSEASARLLQFS